MQLVQLSPSVSAVQELKAIPEFEDAEREMRKGKGKGAVSSMERVVDVCKSAVGRGSTMHVASLRR